MMLWRNWNAAFRIAINEIPVNAVTELAARKIRKSAAFRGDFRRWSSGERMSTPAMNTTPKMIAKEVVMIADVLKILLLSLPGKTVDSSTTVAPGFRFVLEWFWLRIRCRRGQGLSIW